MFYCIKHNSLTHTILKNCFKPTLQTHFSLKLQMKSCLSASQRSVKSKTTYKLRMLGSRCHTVRLRSNNIQDPIWHELSNNVKNSHRSSHLHDYQLHNQWLLTLMPNINLYKMQWNFINISETYLVNKKF